MGNVLKSEKKAKKLKGRHLQGDRLKPWSRLRVRMTISYLGVAVFTALLLELLFGVVIVGALTRSPLVDNISLFIAKRPAEVYALEAAVQAGEGTLDPHATFQPGQPSSLTLREDPLDPFGSVPYIDIHSSPPQKGELIEFALLIAPNRQVLASSYPARYPVSTSIAHILSPRQTQLILNALAGKADSMTEITAQGHVDSVAQPILSKEKKPLGAVYVQMTPPSQIFGANIFWGTPLAGITALLCLIIMAPFGALLGVLTTRGLVRRIHQLVKATAEFAHGDYTQRVPTRKKDEVGQLERQFNSMAEQLVESIAQQQVLTDQHARREERTRIEQEMRTAQYIQHALLPKEVPTFTGWQIATYYQSAKEVGGDLYDFLVFEDGRLGVVIGDVADKGVPAALVMASTRSMLRAAAQVTDSPGEVLRQVNDLLYADTPTGMFVTCFYAVLDPANGKLRYANAGQDLPYLRQAGSVRELHATGMPLGLMPAMCYEEQEVVVAQDENILFYTDGLVEAHNSRREMFGFPRLQTLLAEYSNGTSLIDFLLNELKRFTAEGWEQEDDVTLVTLQRREGHGMSEITSRSATQFEPMDGNDSWQTLDEWTVPSQPGNERLAMERVAEAIKALHLPTKQLERVKTAVAEATMNAMEHGNHYQADVPVAIQVLTSKSALAIRIRDHGGSKLIPDATDPDLDAKLAELQSPRGWGLFLIKNMVDDMRVISDETHHTIELIVYLEGESHLDKTS